MQAKDRNRPPISVSASPSPILRGDDSGSEIFLQEDQGEPAVEFTPDLGQAASFLEAERFVQPDTEFIVGVYSANQGMQTLAPGALDQGGQQRLADPMAAPILAHIDGMFGAQPIARRRPKWPITGIAQQTGG